jgi:hypothetical protein
MLKMISFHDQSCACRSNAVGRAIHATVCQAAGAPGRGGSAIPLILRTALNQPNL